MQNAPLGLTDPNAAKKPKQKADKTRYSANTETAGRNPALSRQTESAPQAAPAAKPAGTVTRSHRLLAHRSGTARHTVKSGEMKEIYVADVGKFENQAVVAFFAVRSKQLRSRKDGGQYMAVTLGDRTGQIESRMWENFAEAAPGFEPGDVVKVRAEVCRYNGRLQLNLEKLRRATEDEFELADYVPQTRKDVEELWSALVRSVDSFSDPLAAGAGALFS